MEHLENVLLVEQLKTLPPDNDNAHPIFLMHGAALQYIHALKKEFLFCYKRHFINLF